MDNVKHLVENKVFSDLRRRFTYDIQQIPSEIREKFWDNFSDMTPVRTTRSLRFLLTYEFEPQTRQHYG